jgi:hypothetical protein
MRIAIDIGRVNEFGIGTYIWNLVRNLSQLDVATVPSRRLVGTHELGPLRPNFTQFIQSTPDPARRFLFHWRWGSWPDVVHIRIMIVPS